MKTPSVIKSIMHQIWTFWDIFKPILYEQAFSKKNAIAVEIFIFTDFLLIVQVS